MYVFGINMPLPEIFFVLTILITVAVVLMWIQFMKLRKLILIQKTEIKRFEEDIEKIKPGKVKSYVKELEAYIRKEMEKGFSKKDIEDMALIKGWPSDIVKKAFESIEKEKITKIVGKIDAVKKEKGEKEVWK